MEISCFDAFHANKFLVTLNNTLPFAPTSYNIFKITCTTHCQMQNYISTTPFPSVLASNPYKYLTPLLLCTRLFNIIFLMANPCAYAGYIKIIAAQLAYNINISVSISGQPYPPPPTNNTCNVLYFPSSMHYVSLHYNA